MLSVNAGPLVNEWFREKSLALLATLKPVSAEDFFNSLNKKELTGGFLIRIKIVLNNEAGEMVQQLRVLALIEDLSSRFPVPVYPVPSSYLHGHQAYNTYTKAKYP